MRLANGLWYRNEDKVIVKEMAVTYGKLPVKKGDIALDLGANIGASAKFMLDKGVSKVIAVEPDPLNLRVAKKNLSKRPAVVIWAAVGKTAGRTTIWCRPDKPYLTSKLRDDGRLPVTVPEVTLTGLLEQYHPSIVKCDIEFGEYDLPELTDLPGYVRVLALEVHVRHDLVLKNGVGTRRKDAANLLASIEAQGFHEVWRRDKKAKDGAVEDDTGLHPLLRSIDGIWSR